jgi:type IV pilus assembly protein PilV
VTAELGTGAACPAAGVSIASIDLNEWCEALQGAAETQGGSQIGAMIGARGCIYQVTPLAAGVPGEYLIAIAWQGFNSTAALTDGPAAACGSGEYGDDAKRRVVTMPVAIADLG